MANYQNENGKARCFVKKYETASLK